MTSYCLQLKRGKYRINNISWNIAAVFLKLGLLNVHHKKNKMTPSVLLPWQQFCRWFCVNKNKNSQFCIKTKTIYTTQPNGGSEDNMGTMSVSSRPSVSISRLQMGVFSFLTERDWSRNSCYGSSTKGVISFLLWCPFVVPSFKNTGYFCSYLPGLFVLDFGSGLLYCPQTPVKCTRKRCGFVSKITKNLERTRWFPFDQKRRKLTEVIICRSCLGLMKFAADKGFSGDKFNAISLGQGQVFSFILSTFFSVLDYLQTKLGLFILVNALFYCNLFCFWYAFIVVVERFDAEVCHAFLPATTVT